MLQIFIGTDELDLDEDIQFDMIIENPFLQIDRIPLPYTLKFNLPESDLNLQKLNYPNRVAAIENDLEFECSISFKNITFFKGILAVEYDNQIVASFRGISLLDALKKKLHMIQMQEYNLPAANLQTVFLPGQYPDKWLLDYNIVSNFGGAYKAKAVSAAYGGEESYAVAPVRIKGQNFDLSTGEFTYPGGSFTASFYMFGVNADKMYFNFWNSLNKDFVLQKRVATTTRDREMEHSGIYPFPYLSYIFDELFSGVLTSNPFATGELSELVLLSTFHPNYALKSQNVNTEEFCGMLFDNSKGQTASFIPSWRINSFLPEIDASELLKNIMKIFCSTVFPKDGTYSIMRNKDILASNVVENWSGKLIETLSIYKSPGQGYKYGYSDIKETNVEVADDHKVTTIKNLIDAEVTDVTFPPYFVTSTGEYYKKERVETTDTYTLLSSGLGGNTDVDNPFDTTSDVGPLPMCIADHWTKVKEFGGDEPTMMPWYVPEYSGDRMTRGNKAYIMFFRGVKPTFTPGEEYPLLTATNYDHFGNRLGDLSLAWEGADGLINRFHAPFREYIQRKKKRISGTFSLDVVDIKNLDLSIKKNINGVNFYVEKITIPFTKYRILDATIDLIQA